MDFTELIDLASERLGGRVLAANDEFFAPKENLLKPAAPIFAADKYTDRGKWMDGWETRRRRTPGCDWCVIALGLPGRIRGIVVDTSFFKGNFPARASLEACAAGGAPSVESLLDSAQSWTPLLPESALIGDSQIKERQIKVDTLRGVVQLSGFVDSMAERREATKVAAAVAGVQDVHNDLLIKMN